MAVRLEIRPRTEGQFEDTVWAAAVFVLNHPGEKLEIACANPASAQRFAKRLQEILERLSATVRGQ